MAIEEKTRNGLMRKTKSELIDIILRKDDVEIRLKEELQSKESEINSCKEVMDSLQNTIDSQCDTINRIGDAHHHAIKKIRRYRNWTIALVVLLAIAVVLAIAL